MPPSVGPRTAGALPKIEAIVPMHQAVLTAARAAELQKDIQRIEENIAKAIYGKSEAIRHLVTTLVGSGHLLIEDVPGVGKTSMAVALAQSIGGAHQRIQFTSDLLPSDIIGVPIFNQKDQTFEFRPGPIFANV